MSAPWWIGTSEYVWLNIWHLIFKMPSKYKTVIPRNAKGSQWRFPNTPQHQTHIRISTNVFQKFKYNRSHSCPWHSLNLPLIQHCLQRALDHSSFAKVHQFNQSRRQNQNWEFPAFSLMFDLQLPPIQLYLDFSNKSIFKIRKLFLKVYPLLENPMQSPKLRGSIQVFSSYQGYCSDAETVFPQMSNIHVRTRTFSTLDMSQYCKAAHLYG